jgi:eukaryotic-like serine/threonine-protein kinase
VSESLSLDELARRCRERAELGETLSLTDVGINDPARLQELRERVQTVAFMLSVLGAGQSADSKTVEYGTLPQDSTPSLIAVESGTLPQSAPPRPIAAEVPGYELLAELGRGGMGVVYKARDLGLNRIVALKMILAGAHSSPTDLARFVAEAEAIAALTHPNIVAIYKIGRHNDLPYFTLEFCPGGSLADKVKDAPLPPRAAVDTVEKLARGIAYAHSKGVVHRDLKPQNVLLAENGVPRITDFGLAKRLADSEHRASDHLTSTGAIMGTPSYMAPEQAAGNKDIGRQADVYALGAILYRLLSGRPPFQAATALETIRQVSNEEPVSLRALNKRLPKDLETICHKCLQKDPTRRYASADDLADDLRRYLNGEPIRARPAGSAERAVKWVKRNPALTAFMAALLLGIAGTAIGLVRAEQARSAEKRRAESESTAKDAAIKAQELAEGRRTEAELARDQARKRYLIALDAFNQMVFPIQDKLKSRPDTQDLRKELLDNARAGLRTLLQEAEKQGNADQTLVWAYLRMGDVELLLGNAQAAEKQYRTAHESAKKLADSDLQSSQAQRDFAISCEKLGDVELQLGQTKDAFDLYRQQHEINDRLAQASPNDAVAQHNLGVSFSRLGDIALRLGKANDALDYYRKAVRFAHGLAEANAQNSQFQHDLSIGYEKLGDVLIQLGQTNEALEFYQKKFDIDQRVSQSNPQDLQARRDLGVAYNKLGDVALKTGRADDALGYFQKYMQITELLAQADPKNAFVHTGLLGSHYKMGIAAQAAFEFSVARERFQEAKSILADFQKKGWFTSPGETLGKLTVSQWQSEIEARLRSCMLAEKAISDVEFIFKQTPDKVTALTYVRVKALSKRKQFTDATATAERFAAWAETQNKNSDVLRYNVAHVLAICAAVANNREALVSQALTWLEKAKANGFFTPQRIADMKQDADFSVIRQHQKFKQFEEHLDDKK